MAITHENRHYVRTAERPPDLVSTPLYIGVAGLLVAAIVILLGVLAVPVRVTFGAGSIRCGSAYAPYTGEGLRDPCSRAARERIRDAAVAGAVFASTGLAAAIAVRRSGATRGLVVAVLCTLWVLALAAAILWFAGARSAT